MQTDHDNLHKCRVNNEYGITQSNQSNGTGQDTTMIKGFL
ncbi:hypothetical Protein YC6258_03012 [Gynuella sunshinyii YC6258]|uniref:Uncharacterized protein n=1 Tax=Gynuella sunshinyii YC6258 TaxID=1445510 RepID=A0A0C5VX86_9GAMM|nr:hypothetical Protein YC6258_03012 [Gynuella sunshinyii YC6258]